MNNVIKRLITSLYKQRNKQHYEIRRDVLFVFIQLKPRTQRLMYDLLEYASASTKTENYTFSVDYRDLGFKKSCNFTMYRNELIKHRFIYFDDGLYFINPIRIDYFTTRQKSYLFGLYKLKRSIPVTMKNPFLKLVN